MLNFLRRGNGKTATMSLDPFDDARRDPNSLGNMALEKGYITKEDLEKALQVQKERLKIGDLLVELGKLTEEQLDELLLEQSIRRGEVKDPEVLIKFERMRRKNRLTEMKGQFKQARVQSEGFHEFITHTLLAVKNGE